MNANELSETDVMANTIKNLTQKVSQQQAEIEALKAKTLTDEEIIEIWSGMETDTGEQNIIFARAILRKAQEKWKLRKLNWNLLAK